MGCDVHMAMEVREDEGSKWAAVMRPNPYFGEYDEAELTSSINISRDYRLFAVLADVRNSDGDERYDSIAPNRGVPDDISEEALAALSDEHSPTWMTLSDILRFDWTRTVYDSGIVDALTYAQWARSRSHGPDKEYEAPKSWSGGVFGGGIKIISEEEMVLKLDSQGSLNPYSDEGKERIAEALGGGWGRKSFSGEAFYTRVRWKVRYSDAGAQLWRSVLPTMLVLGNKHGYDNVRLVMDFDS